MADVDIELTLQGGEVGDGGRRYEPGSTVQGWARLTPVGTVDCRRVVVRLEWHTEGRGDRDQGCADEVELASGPLSGPLVQSFTLTVPQMPWTYAGDYINIIWRVLVVVDIRLAFDIRAEAPIVAAPRRAGRLPPVPPRTNVPPDALPDGRESPSPSSGSPPPPDSTGQEDVLGLRIAAALIDLVLLSGLFVIMGVTVGETSTTGGFYVSLNGWWLVAFVALALLYYFILEAVSGQTVGKRVLGLRVSRAGERAPVGAVAVRTMLRVVDGLPVLYLVGFITMMATGARRQRVGDLAAGTSVVRTPVRHRGLALVALAVVVLAAAGLSVYRVNSPEGPHTYRAHGVSFKYPARWHIGGAETTARAGGAEVLWETAVGPSTKWDVIEVDAYRVNRPVTAQNIDAVIPEVESVTRQLFDQLGGAVQAGPEKRHAGRISSREHRCGRFQWHHRVLRELPAHGGQGGGGGAGLQPGGRQLPAARRHEQRQHQHRPHTDHERHPNCSGASCERTQLPAGHHAGDAPDRAGRDRDDGRYRCCQAHGRLGEGIDPSRRRVRLTAAASLLPHRRGPRDGATEQQQRLRHRRDRLLRPPRRLALRGGQRERPRRPRCRQRALRHAERRRVNLGDARVRRPVEARQNHLLTCRPRRPNRLLDVLTHGSSPPPPRSGTARRLVVRAIDLVECGTSASPRPPVPQEALDPQARDALMPITATTHEDARASTDNIQTRIRAAIGMSRLGSS